MQYPFILQAALVNPPTKDDVLFGRHAQSWNHEGNRRFRAIVSKYQAAYHSAKARIKKVSIVAKIVNEVRSNGARFLRKDKRLNIWYEVDRKACIDKVRMLRIRLQETHHLLVLTTLSLSFPQ